MGSNQGEPDERPAHVVYLDSFYIDRYEVTNAQFADFLNAVGETTSVIYARLFALASSPAAPCVTWASDAPARYRVGLMNISRAPFLNGCRWLTVTEYVFVRYLRG